MAGRDFDSIKSLLVSSEQIENQFVCLFRCPKTGIEERGACLLQVEEEDSEPEEGPSEGPRGLFESVRDALSTSMRVMFQERQEEAQQPTDEEEYQHRVLQAFLSVRSQFRLKDGRWVHRSLDERIGDFRQRLEASPVTEPYDQEILARILLEMRDADGSEKEQEDVFLSEILGESERLLSLRKRHPVTTAELGEVSCHGQRETILLLAWAMAYCDETLHSAELKRLSEIARGFMLDEERISELRRVARLFVVDRALSEVYADGTVDEGELARVRELAARLDLSNEDMDHLERALSSGS